MSWNINNILGMPSLICWLFKDNISQFKLELSAIDHRDIDFNDI